MRKLCSIQWALAVQVILFQRFSCNIPLSFCAVHTVYIWSSPSWTDMSHMSYSWRIYKCLGKKSSSFGSFSVVGGLPCKARFCLSWHLFDKCQLCMQRLHSFDFNHNLKFENSWKFESSMYSLSEPSTVNRFIMRFSASPGSSGSNSQDKNSFTSTEPSLLISAASNIFIARNCREGFVNCRDQSAELLDLHSAIAVVIMTGKKPQQLSLMLRTIIWSQFYWIINLKLFVRMSCCFCGRICHWDCGCSSCSSRHHIVVQLGQAASEPQLVWL